MFITTKRLSNIISAFRESPFELDQSIPPGYITRILVIYVLRRIRGMFMFGFRSNRVFVGRDCTIVGRNQIKINGSINIADGCLINAMSSQGVEFGANVSVQRNVTIECTGSLQRLGKGMQVGSNVGIGADSFMGAAGGIEIGDDTIIGNFVSFHSENHIISDPDIPIRLQGTTRVGIVVGKNCWIGAKVTILDGVNIGDGSVVAAGAVVRAGKYPDLSIIGGVPARLIGSRRLNGGSPTENDI